MIRRGGATLTAGRCALRWAGGQRQHRSARSLTGSPRGGSGSGGGSGGDGGAVFPRSMQRGPLPVAVRGHGCFLEDADGKQYLDGSGGAAVSCLGHSDDYVKAAIKAQLDRLPYAHTSMFTSEPAEALADVLVANAPAGLEHVYFVSGGSEAVEAALKLARQYCVEIGQPGRHHVIARQGSYHGNTLGALASGGNAGRREMFLPLLRPTSHIAACYPYRLQEKGETEVEYGLRAAAALEEEILRLGPGEVMS